jgi:hypothetical protein
MKIIGKDQQVNSSGEHVVTKGQRNSIMEQSAFNKPELSLKHHTMKNTVATLPGKSFSRTFHSC